MAKTRPRRPRRAAQPYGSLIRLRPEFEEPYIILHQNTFPGVLRQIRRSNIRDYSIFLLDGVLFSHFEYRGRDYRADMEAMAADQTTKDWWKLTIPTQEPLPDVPEGQWWTPMELLLRLCPSPRGAARCRRIALKARLLPDSHSSLREVVSPASPDVARAIRGTGFRNLHLYLHDHDLYLYADHTGKSLERDALTLYRSAPFAAWRASIELLLDPEQHWRGMREVFHTA